MIYISHSYGYILTLTLDSITYIHYSITDITKVLYDQKPDYLQKQSIKIWKSLFPHSSE